MSVAAVPGSRTIGRALCVLDSFTLAERQWRTTSLAQHCGLPVPTTHRILRMLESFGYVMRDPNSGAYSLGASAASLARGESLPAQLREAALPSLRTLYRVTGERVSLAALSESRDHGQEVCAVAADDDGALGDREALDTRIRPLHAGASSKVLLAQLSGEEVACVIRHGLEPVGPATITRPLRLRREVAAIRRRGWGFSCEEVVPDRWALAVPVRAPGGASCALGISAPLARFDRNRARRHLAVLKLAAGTLANRLPDRGEELVAAGAAA